MHKILCYIGKDKKSPTSAESVYWFHVDLDGVSEYFGVVEHYTTMIGIIYDTGAMIDRKDDFDDVYSLLSDAVTPEMRSS